jgi:hypothetical protein
MLTLMYDTAFLHYLPLNLWIPHYHHPKFKLASLISLNNQQSDSFNDQHSDTPEIFLL